MTERPVTSEQRQRELQDRQDFETEVATIQRKDDEQRAETIALFNIDDFLVTDEVQEIIVEGVGRVRYKMLNTGDFLELWQNRGDKDNMELGITVLQQLLEKGDPAVTLEKLRRLKLDVTMKILGQLLPFLTEMLSSDGSMQTPTPNPSG